MYKILENRFKSESDLYKKIINSKYSNPNSFSIISHDTLKSMANRRMELNKISNGLYKIFLN